MQMHETRLLLVDDDPSAIQVMGRMLSQYPNQRFATSGEAALRLTRESPPDLIVLDIDMPGMSGLALCETLKADPLLARIPIIFATSQDPTPLLQVDAFQKGAADFVTKPLIAAQLVARVRAQLRATNAFEELQGARQEAGIASGSESEKRPRLLIVDDDVASIHILRHTLAAMGDCYFAKSGHDALELTRTLVPDLILLDAHMPGIDGFEICRKLKADTSFAHVPVVFVTRFSDPRNEMRALDLGASDFIAKPYTRAVLEARVRSLLQQKSRTDAELLAVREHWKGIGDARVAEILETASDAIVTRNAGDKVVLINPAACRMFGVEQAQAIGSAAENLLGKQHPEAAPWQPGRMLVTLASGASFPVEVSTSSVGEGPDRLTTVMLRNVSDRERLDAESRLRIEAETASRTKTQMLSYFAHELGNPLNGMLGFAHLMAADTRQPLQEDQARRLAYIVEGGRHLQTLMRDVMDLGRFEAGKLTIELRPVDVAQCAHDAIAAVSALAEQAGIQVSCRPPQHPLRCIADAARLHQCLVNLLTNAIKYNQPGGWARIDITAEADQIALAVCDNGLGMDAAQCQHLFEPFNRLGRDRLGATPGTGLGLVITRQLVEAMNGKLRVESEPDRGSCFTVVLSSEGEASLARRCSEPVSSSSATTPVETIETPLHG